jgi:hypothetical protein
VNDEEGFPELQEGYVVLQNISENVELLKHLLPSFRPETEIMENQIIGLEGLIKERFNTLWDSSATEMKKNI